MRVSVEMRFFISRRINEEQFYVNVLPDVLGAVLSVHVS